MMLCLGCSSLLSAAVDRVPVADFFGFRRALLLPLLLALPGELTAAAVVDARLSASSEAFALCSERLSSEVERMDCLPAPVACSWFTSDTSARVLQRTTHNSNSRNRLVQRSART